ncbi:MAG: hypothetical protein WAO24_01780 [Peptococcia bacterium]
MREFTEEQLKEILADTDCAFCGLSHDLAEALLVERIALEKAAAEVVVECSDFIATTEYWRNQARRELIEEGAVQEES